jgi:hypothetical protein
MADELIFGVVGMALLAVGTCLMGWRPGSASRALAIFLCVCGIALIATAAHGEPRWSVRVAALGMYSSSGGFLGMTAWTIWAKRHAGPILATLGAVATSGFRIVSIIVISAGTLGVIMQYIDTPQSGSLFMLVGQFLFFATFAVQAIVTSKARWCLTECGISGPNVFVPWQQILAYQWQGSNTLALTTKPDFRGARELKISVVPEASGRVAEMLARRIPQ